MSLIRMVIEKINKRKRIKQVIHLKNRMNIYKSFMAWQN